MTTENYHEYLFGLTPAIWPGEACAIVASASLAIGDTSGPVSPADATALRAAALAWLTANRPGHPAIALLS